MFRLALAGMGIALFNEFIVADALKDGQLVRVLADCHHSETLTQYAIFPKERYRLPRVAAMLNFLTETFARTLWRAEHSPAVRPKVWRPNKSVPQPH
jgi:DNA-binding transcriptional LysR family regulator